MGYKCSTFWPPLLVTDMPTAGEGLKSKFVSHDHAAGRRKTGDVQEETPLHLLGDSMPGQISYVGAFAFGGYWYGLTAKGKMIK